MHGAVGDQGLRVPTCIGQIKRLSGHGLICRRTNRNCLKGGRRLVMQQLQLLDVPSVLSVGFRAMLSGS